MGCVDRAPVGLGGFDEFERHRHAGGAGPESPGDPGAEPDAGEGRLDRVGGAEVDPVLGALGTSRSSTILATDFGNFAPYSVAKVWAALTAAALFSALWISAKASSRPGARLWERGKHVADLVHQQRCALVPGNTSRIAFQRY